MHYTDQSRRLRFGLADITELDVEEIVIPWTFIVVSSVSGSFGSLLGIFLILPQGSTLTLKTIDTLIRMAGGGIAAGLWNTLVTEYSGVTAGRVGHVIGMAGAIGFAWWFVMGGVSIYLNRFRQIGPTSLSLPGRFGWLGDLLSSITLKPPSDDKKTPNVAPPPTTDKPADGDNRPPAVKPPSVIIESKKTGGES